MEFQIDINTIIPNNRNMTTVKNDMNTTSSNNKKDLAAALLLSMAIYRMKKSSPEDYRSLKEKLKSTSKGLTEISNALDDDVISPEEVERILNDPFARECIKTIFPSSNLQI